MLQQIDAEAIFMGKGQGQGLGLRGRGNGGKGVKGGQEGHENMQAGQGRDQRKGKGKGKGQGNAFPGQKGQGKGAKGKQPHRAGVQPGEVPNKGKGKRKIMRHPGIDSVLDFDREKALLLELAAAAKGEYTWATKQASQDLEHRLRIASTAAKNDPEIAIACVSVCGLFIPEFSPAIRDNAEVVIAAVRNNKYALQFGSPDRRADRAVVLEAVKNSGFALQFASFQVLSDREICLVAAKTSLEAAAQADPGFRDDKEFMREVLHYQGLALQFAGDTIRSDKDLVLLALQTDGYALKYASAELQEDVDVVLRAVNSKVDAVHFASPVLKGDKDFMMRAARTCRDLNQVHSLHSQADEQLKQSIPWRSFLAAYRSPLAVPGQLAPILSVSLRFSCGETDCTFRAEANLFSGASFTCEVVDLNRSSLGGPGRSGPRLNDLAMKLLEELPKHAEIENLTHIFVTFLVGDGDSVPVTLWDSGRPLTEFIPLAGT
mmetsp:Transcript_72476/g.151265  ORF Transcript_72476/g.151265 Transcript_72476/m.151265 type:complete len:489 (+) Transcript_72476:209-1675(+)